MSSNYEYDFTHASRGVAHVFVNIEFDKCTQQGPRPGAEKDMTNFDKAFSQLKFNVERHFNCTVKQTTDIIQAYCHKPHDDEDCVVFAFSSHGDQKIVKSGKLASDIIYCKDAFLQVSTITNMLSETKCPGMVNKPKLFFFQACRGDNLSETIRKTGDSDAQVISSQYRWNIDPVEIPLQKDYYVAFSAPPGFDSWRRSVGDKVGSWFVTALRDVIEESSGDSIDLVDLMTSVNHHIAIGGSKPAFISHVSEERLKNNRMSVPWIASMLTKSVIFTRK